MNPLSFITFFNGGGKLATMTVLGSDPTAARCRFGRNSSARPRCVLLMLGGFVWVLGDLFQQYATKVRRHQPRHSSLQHQSNLGCCGASWFFMTARRKPIRLSRKSPEDRCYMALGAVGIALSSAPVGGEQRHAFGHDADLAFDVDRIARLRSIPRISIRPETGREQPGEHLDGG